MSLYGLDIILNDEGFNLVEINGVNSGMTGFSEIYGDDRIKDRVYDMIKQEYGDVSLNDGVFPGREELEKLEYINKISESVDKPARALPRMIRKTFPFEPYRGQDSTVFNFVNQRIEHEQVNRYETSEIVKNDFLLSQLIKDTEIGEYFPETAPLVKEAEEKGHLREVALMGNKMVVKPAKGFTGIGVQTLSPIMYPRLSQEYIKLRKNEGDNSFYKGNRKDFRMKEFVEDKDFKYERALGILQPMINSDKDIYGCMRAIVCNGEYVDAYERVSEKEIVNFTNGAEARYFHEPEGFDEFCESVVSTLEEESEKLGEGFREELYNSYLDDLGVK